MTFGEWQSTAIKLDEVLGNDLWYALGHKLPQLWLTVLISYAGDRTLRARITTIDLFTNAFKA